MEDLESLRHRNDSSTRVNVSILSEQRSPLMGFAILFIMLFHFESHNPFFHTQFFIIGDIGVDCFLLLSGLGNYYSLSRTEGQSVWQFYKRKILRILPAFWIMIIPVSLFQFMKHDISLTVFFTRIFGLSAFNEGARGYWYLTALLVCYIISPLLYDIYKKSNKKDIIVVLSSFILCYILSFLLGVEILFRRLPVFVLGMYIGKLCFIKNPSFNIILALIISCLLYIYTQCYRINSSSESPIYRLLSNVLSLPLMISMAYLISIPVMKNVRILFDFMGKISLELYLIHIFIMRFFSRYFVSLESYIIYFLLFFFGSILLSYLLHLICGYLLNSKLLSRYCK